VLGILQAGVKVRVAMAPVSDASGRVRVHRVIATEV
jgi:hypothetical protein